MMKRNILISVVLGLVLAFGMIIASCDNGVLPKYTSDPDQKEWDLEEGYPNGTQPTYPGYDPNPTPGL